MFYYVLSVHHYGGIRNGFLSDMEIKFQHEKMSFSQYLDTVNGLQKMVREVVSCE